MQNALLATKMHIPQPRPGLVPRPNLVGVLNKRPSCKVTLVSAPAGYGKTTLISNWATALKTSVAWLTLDTGDNDPSRFLDYLYAALHNAAPDFDLQGLPIPASVGLEHTAPIATAVINALASVGKPLVLVLDDYHCITSEVHHRLLRSLIAHLPQQMHVVLLTRVDPPLPIARWRAQGDLREIRASDLRFSRDEVRQYLRQAVSTPLTEHDIEAIGAKSEGWITGLQLTALSLSKQQDTRRFIQSFSGSHEYIADYLIDEVVSGQPADVQSFLLQTSILDHLSGELCDVTLDRSGSQITLEQLARDNLFVVPLDTDRQWFRYHQLFADLLRKRLHTLYPQRVPDLYARASRWHEQQGLIDEAIRYASATSNGERIRLLVENHVLTTILEGQLYQAHAWLRALPERRIHESPVLCAAEAWISIRRLSTDRAHDCIDRAEEMARERSGQYHPDIWTTISRHIAVLKAAVARTEGKSPEEQLKLIHQGLAVVPSTDQALWGMLILRLGLCYLDLGDDHKADQAFLDVIAAAAKQTDYSVFVAIYARTIIAHLRGRLRDIVELCNGALDHAAAMSGAPWQKVAAHAFAHTALGLVELEFNNLDNADYHLHRALSLNAASGVTELRIKGQYALGKLSVAQGNRPQPIDLGTLRDGVLPELAAYAQALQSHLWLLEARLDPGSGSALDRATTWAATQSLGTVSGRDRDWQIKRQLVYIRVLLALAAAPRESSRLPGLSETIPVLDDLYVTFSAVGWDDRVIEILIVKARVLDSLGEGSAALASLNTALELAEPQGYVRSFLDEGQTLIRLLTMCSHYNTGTSTYAGHLLAQYSRESIAPPVSPSRYGRPIRPLTHREIEVLTLIAEGMTNMEIAHNLSIALGTVKRHTANINDKLDTRTRTQAVAIARSLGLLT